MRRVYFLILVLFGMTAATFGQSTSSDSQALQAVLIEVRGLRQDLQVSLGRIQSAQILLSRLQIQEVAVTRASQHLDEARSKLAEVEVAVKSEQAEIKHFEDEAPNAAGERTAQIEEALKRARSDLEVSTNLEQQRQATEIEAEQQLRTAQDKLNSLENQLDELVKDIRKPSAQSSPLPR